MAEVSTDTSQRIDYLLDHLLREWRDLPRVEREIDQWDLIEQIDYVEEWAPTEGLRAEIEGYVAERLLDASQQERYSELQSVIAENRPILTRLRSS